MKPPSTPAWPASARKWFSMSVKGHGAPASMTKNAQAAQGSCSHGTQRHRSASTAPNTENTM